MQPSLCQPGGGKGCSACCGLFNQQDISRQQCEKLLTACGVRFDPSTASGSGEEDILSLVSGAGPRDMTSHVCPFQGFIAAGTPGCLAHPAMNGGTDFRKYSLFGSKICGDFLCPAHSILDDTAASILVAYTNDWYAYSVGIIDPYSFTWILDCCRSVKGGSVFTSREKREEETLLLSEALNIHAEYLNTRGAPVFHYGLSEYTAAAEHFSLVSAGTEMEDERWAIYSFIKGGVS